eukprot:m.66585 g.66585  ORF g.66585 m.66585 type:complete len:225 (+) comp13762_c0_seq1:342-1016(+)
MAEELKARWREKLKRVRSNDRSLRDKHEVPGPSLRMSSMQIQDGNVEEIATALEENTVLCGFAIASNSISDAALPRLCLALSPLPLRAIYFSTNNFTTASMPAICQMITQLPYLHSLALSNNPVATECKSVEALVIALSKHATIRCLWLHRCGLTDEGMAVLAGFICSLDSLEVLDIDDNKLTEDSLGPLAQIRACLPAARLTHPLRTSDVEKLVPDYSGLPPK